MYTRHKKGYKPLKPDRLGGMTNKLAQSNKTGDLETNHLVSSFLRYNHLDHLYRFLEGTQGQAKTFFVVYFPNLLLIACVLQGEFQVMKMHYRCLMVVAIETH